MQTTLFRASRILSRSSRLHEDAALAVQAGRIVALGPYTELRIDYPQARLVDFGDALLLPPLVNAHCHLELTHFPHWLSSSEQTEIPRTFVDWIKQVIRIKRGCLPEQLSASISQGLRDSLAYGTGALGDNLSISSLSFAYDESPLLGRFYLETLGIDPEQTEPSCVALLEQAGQGARGMLQPGLAPHSPYTLSSAYLKQVAARARQHGLPLSIHLAESPDETQFLLGSAGAIADELYPFVGWGDRVPPAAALRPVPYLLEHLDSRPATLLVHGVHVNQDEIRTLAATGATVVLCPRSNHNLGVGEAPIAQYLEQGVPLALGTDSLASVPSLSLWDEISFLRSRIPRSLDPALLLHMATLGGARALGLDGEMGTLEPGWGAHFQVLRPPASIAAEQLLEALCHEGGSWPLDALYLGGVNRLQKGGTLD